MNPILNKNVPDDWQGNWQGKEKEEGELLLSNERACSSVRPDPMATYLYGQATLNKRLQAFAFLADDPIFTTDDRPNHNQVARYNRSAEKAVRFINICKRKGIAYDDMTDLLNVALDEITPIDVHMKMVVPTLCHQTTREQREKWLPLAQDFKILCAYAQTELGHGSNVRGLETTASYDQATETFILHSPTLTATKWWPGGLGKTATHAVVLARLLLGSQDMGIHTFFVQIRDLTDHSPMPGITLGDIGPKMGFSSTDNGFLVFNNVRLPRMGMCMGLVEVTPDGKYIKKKGNGAEKILYSAMLDVRAGLVERGGVTLARALTVSIRYSAVRKQGYAPNSSSGSNSKRAVELQVLEYPTQQHALFPLLAWAYALQATGRYMRRIYRAYVKTLDMSLLPEVHALSSGLKALVAQVVSGGIETCRSMCGGHGYLQSSGLPEVYANYVAVNTFEGTQQVLEPQTARFILRLAAAAGGGAGTAGAAGGKKKGQATTNPPFALSADFDYLKRIPQTVSKRCRATESKHLLDPSLQIEAFEARICALLLLLNQAIQGEKKSEAAGAAASDSNSLLAEAMMTHGVLVGKLSRAHCQLVIMKRFHESIEKQERRLQGNADVSQEDDDDIALVGHAEVRVLRDLCHLFALSTMEKEMADFRARDYLTADQALMCSQEVRRLCLVIRPEAVSLVDAFKLPDQLLSSTLGRYDGRVYNALFDQALKAPLNEKEVSDAYHLHWRQLLQSSHGGYGGGSRL